MKRRPSGRNAEQLPRSVTDGSGEEIPVTKDAGTFIYITPDGFNWPKRPLVGLSLDVAWLQEGDTISLRDLRPGFSMGRLSLVRLLAVRTEIIVHKGKWGQVRREVLGEEIPEEVSRAT